MTREQKFEARLTELGLLDEWNKVGRYGRVGTTDADGNIIILVNEGHEDAYTEIHYPPFEELRKRYFFVKNCILEWKGFGADFEMALDKWLDAGGDCPLYPVDVYFPANGMETFSEDFKDDFDGVMTDVRNHDASLVEQINEKWVRYRDSFRPILQALYERDIEEITDAFSFQIPAWRCTPQYIKGERTDDWSDYNAFALECMKADWEGYAENYLMHVADNQDLECILLFVRCDVAEGTGRDRQ